MSISERGIMSDLEWRSLGGRLVIGLIILLTIILSVVVILPFFFTFTAGLKTSSEIFKPGLRLLPEVAHWNNYLDAWKRFNISSMFLDSFLVAGGGVVGQLFVSSLAAYSISRLNPVGKKFIFSLFLVSMTIPGIAYLITRYAVIVDLKLVNNFLGLWLPYSASAFTILVLKNFFDHIPSEYYDAAQLDGASPLRIFFSITIPLSQSIMIVLGMMAFVGFWSDFLMPLLVLRDTALQPITVRLFTMTRQFPMNLHLAGAFIGMVPPILAAIFLQRFLKGGLTYI